MAKRINQLTKVKASTGDTYVIYDVSTGEAGTVDVITDDYILDLNAGGGLLSKDGLQLVSATNLPVQFGEVVAEPITKQRAQVGLLNNTVPDMVHEFGQMSNASGSWHVREVTVGGMVFKWSAAATNTGAIQWRRAANTDAPIGSGGTQQFIKYTNGTATTVDSVWFNHQMFSNDWQTTTSPALDASLRTLQINMWSSVTGVGHYWRVTITNTGYNNLVVTVEYFGPKYISLKGTN